MFDFGMPSIDTRSRSEEGLPCILRNAYGPVILPPLKVEASEPEPVPEGLADDAHLPAVVTAPAEPKYELATLHLLGPDSLAYRGAQHDQAIRRAQRMAAGIEVTQAMRDADVVQILAAVTTGWNLRTPEGVAIPFSPEAAVAFYTGYPWARDQADDWCSNRVRFTKAS